MTQEHQGPEPTGWELLRAINALQSTMAQTVNTFVQQAVYNADKRGVDDRFARLEARTRETEQNMASAETRHTEDAEKLRIREEQARKNTASVRLAIVLAVVGPIAGFVLSRIPIGGS